METHHKKRMSRPNPTTPITQPHHYIQHTSQLALHNINRGQHALLILRPTQPPDTTYSPKHTQHTQTMVHHPPLNPLTITHCHTTSYNKKHTKPNGWLELWSPHAPHQPSHHISRSDTHSPTQSSTRPPTITNTPSIYLNRRTRQHNTTNNTRTMLHGSYTTLATSTHSPH